MGDREKVNQALRLIHEGYQRLRELGVSRTLRDPLSDYAEWWVKEQEGGALASSACRRDWDVEGLDIEIGERRIRKIQVKKRRTRVSVDKPDRSHAIVNRPKAKRLGEDGAYAFVWLRDDLTVDAYYLVPAAAFLSGEFGKPVARKWEVTRAELDANGYRRGPAPQEQPGTELVALELSVGLVTDLRRVAEEQNKTTEQLLRDRIEENVAPLVRDYGDPTDEERRAFGQALLDLEEPAECFFTGDATGRG